MPHALCHNHGRKLRRRAPPRGRKNKPLHNSSVVVKSQKMEAPPSPGRKGPGRVPPCVLPLEVGLCLSESQRSGKQALGSLLKDSWVRGGQMQLPPFLCPFLPPSLCPSLPSSLPPSLPLCLPPSLCPSLLAVAYFVSGRSLFLIFLFLGITLQNTELSVPSELRVQMYPLF